MKSYSVVFYFGAKGSIRTAPLPLDEIIKIKKWLLSNDDKPYFIEYKTKRFKTDFAIFYKNNLVCVDFDREEWEE
jgi:hypothetical protein